ncbi:MAG: RNA polymerase-binding protein DksA [Pseudomonadota bacterium]
MATKKTAKLKAVVKKIAKPAVKAASKNSVNAKPKSAGKPAAKIVKKPVAANKAKPAIKKPVAKAPVKTTKPAVKKPVVKSPVVKAKPKTNTKVSTKTITKVPAGKATVKAVVSSTGKTAKVNAVPEKPVTPVKQSVTKPKSEPSKPSPIMNSAPSKPTSAAASKTDTVKTEKKSQSKKPPATYDSETKGFTPYDLKKGEEYMNEAQKDHFKRILLNWRNELMEEVDRTVHHMQDEAANPPDPADRATLEEEFSIELRTRDRERRLIKKIDSTIELIANDDYGYCESCGVEIGIRRLEARPTANKCIDCKTLDEIKEKQLGAP